MFLICTGGSLAAIVLGTELGFFQRILGTVHLTCTSGSSASWSGSPSSRCPRPGGCCSSDAARRRARPREPQDGVPAVSPMPGRRRRDQ